VLSGANGSSGTSEAQPSRSRQGKSPGKWRAHSAGQKGSKAIAGGRPKMNAKSPSRSRRGPATPSAVRCSVGGAADSLRNTSMLLLPEGITEAAAARRELRKRAGGRDSESKLEPASASGTGSSSEEAQAPVSVGQIESNARFDPRAALLQTRLRGADLVEDIDRSDVLGSASGSEHGPGVVHAQRCGDSVAPSHGLAA